ncbi:hypothetical protein NW768_007666 [Fusarium equiseti]|uniref:Chitin-binding type-1 domain-containing protein n=1 Tax=Fusarium equiseti TaxID=61235 RepID=A0ABQ8R8D1_FUSEQ|nr:hypothetical protein NW768_007666 [Fusarium equiseti]
MRWISITALVSASLFPAAIASPCRPHSTTTFGVSTTATSVENPGTTTVENPATFTTTAFPDATTTAAEGGTSTKAKTTLTPEAETRSTAETLTTTTNAEITADLPEISSSISISTQATSPITTDTTMSSVLSSSSADTTTSSSTTSPSVPTFLANTGFDDQPGTTQPWSLSSPNIGSLSLDSNIVHDGINSARIDFLTYAGSKYVEQAYGSAIEAGHTYSVSVWTKGGSGCSQTSSSLVLPRANNPISEDGNCGSNSDINATCLGSEFGNCCSVKGYCGKTSAYCDEGCQSSFGKCGGSKSDGQLVSTSGSCGITSSGNNVTCQGSEFGNCCSAKGYCGKVDTYCGEGCQSGFGTCSSDDKSSTASTATHKTATLIPTSSKEDATSADNTSTSETTSTSEEATSSTDDVTSVDSTTTSEAASSTDNDASVASTTSSTDVDSPSSSVVSTSAGTKAGITVCFVFGQLGAISLLAWF